MAKQPSKALPLHTVCIRVGGALSTDVAAASLEEAINIARGYTFKQIISGHYINLSLETEVTGVFKNE